MNIVRAPDLERWADSLMGRADLPGLIASLIRASCPSLQAYRFPTGDASQTHGFDGIAEVIRASTFLPEGRSIWEFGAGQNYKAKATDDFRKRTDQVNAADRFSQSFVFVTPRIWDTGLSEWENERHNFGWKIVRVLDANSLELWLSHHPPISIPFAAKLGIIPPLGVRGVADFWDDYRFQFAPPLDPALLLSGRKEKAAQYCESLIQGLPGLSKWQADSAAEAAAFVACAILSADQEIAQFLISRTLFIDSLETARTMPATGRFHLILHPSTAQVGPALARSNQVTLVLGSDDRALEVNSLERINTRDFAAGLKAMGIDDEEAFHLSGICGRSVTVLSRLKPSAVAKLPVWHQENDLIPLALAGGWDASNEYDCNALASLCNKPYEKVDADARKFGSMPDAPLDLEGSVWTTRSPMDAFILLGCLIDAGIQRRFRAICLDVFSEIDLTLETPEAERPIIPIRGADFRHSEWLRRGLSTTLLLMAAVHKAAKFRPNSCSADDYVDGIVRDLPGLKSDARLLASLKSEFPKLAEAAPYPLVSALEQVLEGDSKSWSTIIFQDRKDAYPLGRSTPHTHILWGLETLAWSPIHLPKAAALLMTLAHSDPGGSLSNRPLQSLREIFLAWRPNTYAHLEERVAVLGQICRSRPRVGLDLALSLLRTQHDTSMGNARPRLRNFGEAERQPITVHEVETAYREYAHVAVDVAGTDLARLTAVIDHIPELYPSARENVMLAIRSASLNATEDQAFVTWSTLRDFVQKHRFYQHARWALPPEDLEPLEELCRELSPKDPIRAVQWLFDEYVPKFTYSPTQDYVGEAHRERSSAVKLLLEQHGLGAVINLARGAKHKDLVGLALADVADVHLLRDAMTVALTPGSGLSDNFAIALSSRAHETKGHAWDDWISDVARDSDVETAAKLFLRWSDSRQTWSFVSTIGNTVEREYWKRKPAFKQVSEQDLRTALDKYMEVGRFTACVEIMSYEEHRVSTNDCFTILRGLVGEVNEKGWGLENVQFAVVHMLEDLQKREDVDIGELAALEYQFLPLLHHQGEPIALQRVIAASPKFFISVLNDVFYPSSGERAEVDERIRARARIGYQLLQSIKTVPGFSDQHEDIGYLRQWIAEARELAKKTDRARIADQQIGQILAYAPADPSDEAWPRQSIRDVIEDLAEEEIENGISVGRFNMRGAFFRDMYDGGKEERSLADEYRLWSSKTRRWPRTSALLNRIADGWDRSAERAESETRLDQLRDI